MLYKLKLNENSPQVQRDRGNVHDMHRTVCRMFDKGALWRLEDDMLYARGKPLLFIPRGYIVSAEAADDVWSRQMRFSLLANPTVAKKRDGKKNSVRVSADPLEWLTRKGEMSGFEVVRAGISKQYTAIGYKPGHRLAFNAVDFEGELRVVDWTLFAKAVEKGIGPAKGYGFGLLLCQPEGDGHI